MSKLGSAPPPPPYKVPLSERLFGINKLKPPATDGVGNGKDDLLSTVRLGNFSLELDERGSWQMDARLEQMYRAQITALESKVAQLEDERLNRSAFELEKRNLSLERERLQLMDENQQLKFKNKVLMAMCTISEGDYKALCKEAGIEPRSQKKPLPAPLPMASQQQQPATSPANAAPSLQQQASLASSRGSAGNPLVSPGAPQYAQIPQQQQQQLAPPQLQQQYSTTNASRIQQQSSEYQIASAR